MATTKIASLSIAEIEKQIAKIGTEIEKARAKQLTDAEKHRTAAEKTLATAQATLANLITKGATTPAAKARITAAKEACANHSKALTVAEQTLAMLVAERKAAERFSKKVAKTLAKSTKKSTAKADKKSSKALKKTSKRNTSETIVKQVATQNIEPATPATTPEKAVKVKAVNKPIPSNAVPITENENTGEPIAPVDDSTSVESPEPVSEVLPTTIEQPGGDAVI